MRTTRPHDQILNAATQLFYTEGIEVSIERIVAYTGVASTTLYRNFGRKETLVAAALEQWSAQWLEWLTDQVNQYDREVRLMALWNALEEWFATEGFRGSFVINAAIELQDNPEHPGQSAIRKHRVELRRLLKKIAKMADAHDPADLAAKLQVLIDGAIAAGRDRPAIASARALTEAAFEANSRCRQLLGRRRGDNADLAAAMSHRASLEH